MNCKKCGGKHLVNQTCDMANFDAPTHVSPDDMLRLDAERRRLLIFVLKNWLDTPPFSVLSTDKKIAEKIISELERGE